MTLEEAVAYAQQNNPRVGIAAAAVLQARGRVTQRRAERRPQLGMTNSVFTQGPVQEAIQANAAPITPNLRWDVGVALSQILLDFGQRAARQRAAERDVAAAGFRLGEAQNDVRLVVSTTFYNVLRAQELLTVANERRASAAEQLRVARARFEADVAPRFDVLRSEAELANADQDVIRARNDAALAGATLNNALGRDVTTPVRLAYTPELNRPDVPFETAREAAIRQRPQLAALRETLESTRQEIRARRAENKPQIGLGAGYDRRNQTGFSQGFAYSAGLTMTFPFFDSGLTRGRVREAQGTLEADRQTLEQARQQVELDIRQAQLDIAEARQRITTSQTELQSAREALRVARVRYQAGVGTNVEVTDAQVAVARAGQNLANAQFDYETAITRLESATGTPIGKLQPGGPAAPAAPATPAPAVAAPPAPLASPQAPSATPAPAAKPRSSSAPAGEEEPASRSQAGSRARPRLLLPPSLLGPR
jgi:TolC family type I secretion outer membrane protein